MLVFLDTEFTKLTPEAKLISIALVDEHENYFYAELNDTYKIGDCSEFVKTTVLPILRGGEYRMSRYECALRMGNWIDDRGPDCIIATDAPTWDLPFLRDLLDPYWPLNLSKEMSFPVFVPDTIKNELIIRHNYAEHNALDDALIMKKAIVGY